MNITAINSYTPKPNVTPVSFQEVISPVSYPEKKKMSDSTSYDWSWGFRHGCCRNVAC